jgi:hypothetical protein
MQRTLCLILSGALFGGLLLATPAQAGPREREIKRLEAKLKDLRRSMRRALEFRAKYATLRANNLFLDKVLGQDRRLLRGVFRQLNSPVVVSDAFLSWVKNDFTKAKRHRGKYNPPSTYLWLNCRFGLAAVKARKYYTIRIDVVDAQSGVRIFQSLKPTQRRIRRVREFIPVRIHGLKIVGGNYKIRVVMEVGRARSKRLVRFKYNRSWRRKR